MAITPTLLSSGFGGANTTTVTTASITPVAGSLLVVVVFIVKSTAVPTMSISSNTGSWTFTNQCNIPSLENLQRHQVYTAKATGTTGTITFSWSSASTMPTVWQLIQIAGCDQISASPIAPSMTSVSTTSGSISQGPMPAARDLNSRSFVFTTTNSTITKKAAWTEIAQTSSGTGNIESQWSGPSAFDANWSVTWTAGDRAIASWLEIYGTEAAAAVPVTVNWNVTGSVTKTSQTLWNISSAVTKTSQVLWNIFNTTPVTKTSQVLWNVLTSLTKTLQVLWSVSAKITKTTAVTWGVAYDVPVSEIVPVTTTVTLDVYPYSLHTGLDTVEVLDNADIDITSRNGSYTDEWWDINGIPLHSLCWSIKTIGGSRFGVPNLRGEDQQFAYRPGKSFRPKLPDSRVVTLIMWVAGMDCATGQPSKYDQTVQWNDNWNTLRRLFWSPTEQLVLTRRWKLNASSPVVVSASALCQLSGTMDPTMTGRTRADFAVDLLLADPFFYGAQIDVTLQLGQQVTISNPGDDVSAFSNLAVRFVGGMGTIRITNIGPGNVNPPPTPVWTQLNTAIDSGDYVTMNVAEFTAQRASDAVFVTNTVVHSGARPWFTLKRGDNLVTLTGLGTGYAVLSYRPPYL